MITSFTPCEFIKMFIKMNGLLSQLESHGISCIFVMFRNKVATAMFSRKDEVEKEEKVTPCIFLFALKLLVSQKKKTWKAQGCS